MEMRAIIYRFGLGDCTLDGITSKKGSVIISDDPGSEADMILKKKNVGGEYLYLEPTTNGSWAMGGNYAKVDGIGFVPCHDRDLRKEVA